MGCVKFLLRDRAIAIGVNLFKHLGRFRVGRELFKAQQAIAIGIQIGDHLGRAVTTVTAVLATVLAEFTAKAFALTLFGAGGVQLICGQVPVAIGVGRLEPLQHGGLHFLNAEDPIAVGVQIGKGHVSAAKSTGRGRNYGRGQHRANGQGRQGAQKDLACHSWFSSVLKNCSF